MQTVKVQFNEFHTSIVLRVSDVHTKIWVIVKMSIEAFEDEKLTLSSDEDDVDTCSNPLPVFFEKPGRRTRLDEIAERKARYLREHAWGCEDGWFGPGGALLVMKCIKVLASSCVR